MQKKLNMKQKIICYLLNQDSDLGYSQEKIANFMGCSQATVSNAVKDIIVQSRIAGLEKEINKVRYELKMLKNNDQYYFENKHFLE